MKPEITLIVQSTRITTFRAYCLLLLLACTSFLATQQAQAQIAPEPPSEIAADLQEIVNQAKTTNDLNGLIAGVYRPNQWAWYGASGSVALDSAVHAQAHFPFRIGSISKSFVAVALLQLQERGVVDLDAWVGEYVDNDLLSPLVFSDDFTLRNLLNHTSGLGNYTDSQDFANVINFNPTASFAPATLLEYGAGVGASFPPGGGWSYSNTNYVLAALAIENVTGMSHQSYIAENIFEPLGMTESYFPTTDTLAGETMGVVTIVGTDFSVQSHTWTFGAGAIVSTLNDLMKWHQGIMEQKIIGEAAWNEFFDDVFIGTGQGYGLGIINYDDGVLELNGHGGSVGNASIMYYIESVDAYLIANSPNYIFESNDLLIPVYEYLLDQPTVSINNLATTYCELDNLLLLDVQPEGGTLSGSAGVGDNYFDPAAAGIGTHTVSYTYEDITYTETIEVLPLPVLDAITQEGNWLIMPNTGYNYQWLLNDEPIEGATASTYYAVEEGNYAVNVSVGICDYIVTTISTGIAAGDLQAMQDLLTYPNPTQEQFTVAAPELSNNGQVVFVQVFNLQGQLVYQNTWTETNTDKLNINANDWQKGLYLGFVKQGAKQFQFKIEKM